MLLGGQGVWILDAVLIAWTFALTIWVFLTARHYKRLVGKTNREDLKSILETLLKQQVEVEHNLQDIKAVISEFEKKSLVNVQRVGIVKFNPYAEAGGNHSFALCLLDGHDNGFIILSLHGREGSRLYLKEVRSGKSEYELSREEQQALIRAKTDKMKQ